MASLSLTVILIIITCGISLLALNNAELMQKLIMNPYITERRKEYYRFVTSGFLHADLMHLAFNMLSFYFFGEAVESFLGGAHFIILYLAAIIISDIPTYLKHKNNPGYNSLGASGGVAAIIFAFVMLYPTSDIYIYAIPVPAIVYGPLFLLYSFYMDRRNTDNTNHSAHLYGAIVGIAYTTLFEPSVISNFIETITGSF
ncbi:MAG: rhomboid family intramembrane serine protease [Cytophagales bacterium]|nr:rhomboid family intramembrane serine protease [Cytophaga sp.]